MIEYTLKGICGHDFKKSRDDIAFNRSYQDWAEEHLECPDCFKVRTQRETKAARAYAVQKAAEYKLAPLQGTADQIAWALILRQEKIDQLIGIKTEDVAYDLALFIKRTIAQLKTESQAYWFIERQHVKYDLIKLQAQVDLQKETQREKDLCIVNAFFKDKGINDQNKQNIFKQPLLDFMQFARTFKRLRNPDDPVFRAVVKANQENKGTKLSEAYVKLHGIISIKSEKQVQLRRQVKASKSMLCLSKSKSK